MSLHPSFEDLVLYTLGDAPAPDLDRIEEHFVECTRCTALLEQLTAVAAALRQAMTSGAYAGPATKQALERLESAGLHVRRYDLSPGGAVACTAFPEDDCLGLTLGGVKATSVDCSYLVEGLPVGSSTRFEQLDIPVDVRTGSVVMLLPGDIVRSYPRSVWHIEVRSREPNAAALRYRLDHTPYQELGG